MTSIPLTSGNSGEVQSNYELYNVKNMQRSGHGLFYGGASTFI